MEPDPQIAEMKAVPQIAEMEPVPQIAEKEPVPQIAELEPEPQIAEMEPDPQIAELEPVFEIGEPKFSQEAPLVKIYGNDLYVADQFDKATKGNNGNLYLTDVINFDVRGHINVGFLKSNKTYKAVFEVDDICTDVDDATRAYPLCVDIKILVYDPTKKEIKDATMVYPLRFTRFETDSFKKLSNEGELIFRLVRRSKTRLRSITIKHLTLHEEGRYRRKK